MDDDFVDQQLLEEEGWDSLEEEELPPPLHIHTFMKWTPEQITEVRQQCHVLLSTLPSQRDRFMVHPESLRNTLEFFTTQDAPYWSLEQIESITLYCFYSQQRTLSFWVTLAEQAHSVFIPWMRRVHFHPL